MEETKLRAWQGTRSRSEGIWFINLLVKCTDEPDGRDVAAGNMEDEGKVDVSSGCSKG